MEYHNFLKILPFAEGLKDLISITMKCHISFYTLREILASFDEEVLDLTENTVYFKQGAKIEIASAALKRGASIKEISQVLDWKDFENLTNFFLIHHDYRTFQNFRLKRPKVEIDVLAIRGDEALAIDCKHWKYTIGTSNMRKIIDMQINRCSKLLKNRDIFQFNFSYIIPIIVTLHHEKAILINGVPIVPIEKFGNFLLDIKGELPSIYTIQEDHRNK
jgi:hypothetical protein